MKFWLLLGALLVLASIAVAVALLWTPDRPRGALEAKYLNAPSDYIEVAGLRLHVRDSGPKTAPALIMLHGFGSSLHTWEPWARALSAHYRVVRYDLPGSGLTGADPTGDYTDTRGMVVLMALLDKLGITRATLIGNSLGGRLAWTFAAIHPDRVERLVLISPDGFRSAGVEYGKAAETPMLVHLMKYVLPKSIVRAGLAPAYGDPGRLSDAVVDRYYDLMLAPGVRQAQITKMGQVILLPPEPLLAKITAPTLLLWGDNDGMIPIGNAADYLKAISNARLVTLIGLGHVPFEEDPTTSLIPLQHFLPSAGERSYHSAPRRTAPRASYGLNMFGRKRGALDRTLRRQVQPIRFGADIEKLLGKDDSRRRIGSASVRAHTRDQFGVPDELGTTDHDANSRVAGLPANCCNSLAQLVGPQPRAQSDTCHGIPILNDDPRNAFDRWLDDRSDVPICGGQ